MFYLTKCRKTSQQKFVGLIHVGGYDFRPSNNTVLQQLHNYALPSVVVTCSPKSCVITASAYVDMMDTLSMTDTFDCCSL